MATIQDILGLPDAGAPAPRQAQRRSSGAAGSLDALVDTVASIEGELNQEIMATFIETRLARAYGLPAGAIHIPRPGEREAQMLKAEEESRRLRRELAQYDLDAARAAILDSPAIKAAGVDPNEILKDPKATVQAANELGVPITLGTFSLARDPLQDVGSADVAAERQEREVSALRRTASALDAQQDIVQATTGKRPSKIDFPGQAREALDTAEEATGFDFTASVFGRDTDFDEAVASGAVIDAYNQSLRTQTESTRGLMARGWMSQIGGELKDILEELPVDEMGRIVVGGGSADADPEAALNMALLAKAIAKDANMPDSDLLANVGLEATGFNDEAIIRAGVAAAVEAGIDPEEKFQQFGLKEWALKVAARMNAQQATAGR